jgi:hypothetical protein
MRGMTWREIRGRPYHQLLMQKPHVARSDEQGPAHVACHVTGCRLTQETRVQDDLDDVASDI